MTSLVPCPGVSDQSQSPTCWVFGTNSLFESDLKKKYGLDINLSEMFIARYAYIDKAKRFLETKGKTYFEGGGQFHDVIRVIENHGMVPEEVYDGKPHGEYNHDHASLDSAMKKFITRLLNEGKTEMSSTDIEQINNILDNHLGKIPTHFMFNQKQYTPESFAKEFTHFNNDYVEIVSFTDHPYYKQFVLVDKYNWANDRFYNLSLDDMLELVDTALVKGWSVGWEGDVTEKEFDYHGGYAFYQNTPDTVNELRLASYKDESTERDHMLHIVGVGKDENNRKWFYLKNSWGTYFSRFKGYLFMDPNYFKQKTVILFVNKLALPQDLKNKMGIE